MSAAKKPSPVIVTLEHGQDMLLKVEGSDKVIAIIQFVSDYIRTRPDGTMEHIPTYCTIPIQEADPRCPDWGRDQRSYIGATRGMYVGDDSLEAILEALEVRR